MTKAEDNARLATLEGALGENKAKMLKLYAERDRHGLTSEACANAAGYSKSLLYDVKKTPEGAEYLELYSQQLEEEGTKSSADIIHGEPTKVSDALKSVYNLLHLKAMKGDAKATEQFLKYAPLFTDLEDNNWRAKTDRNMDLDAILAEIAKM